MCNGQTCPSFLTLLGLLEWIEELKMVRKHGTRSLRHGPRRQLPFNLLFGILNYLGQVKMFGNDLRRGKEGMVTSGPSSVNIHLLLAVA